METDRRERGTRRADDRDDEMIARSRVIGLKRQTSNNRSEAPSVRVVITPGMISPDEQRWPRSPSPAASSGCCQSGRSVVHERATTAEDRRRRADRGYRRRAGRSACCRHDRSGDGTQQEARRLASDDGIDDHRRAGPKGRPRFTRAPAAARRHGEEDVQQHRCASHLALSGPPSEPEHRTLPVPRHWRAGRTTPGAAGRQTSTSAVPAADALPIARRAIQHDEGKSALRGAP